MALWQQERSSRSDESAFISWKADFDGSPQILKIIKSPIGGIPIILPQLGQFVSSSKELIYVTRKVSSTDVLLAAPANAQSRNVGAGPEPQIRPARGT